MALFDDRESLGRRPLATRAARSGRYNSLEAQWIETDDDPATDHVLVDPLDDRERRCALFVRSH